MNTPSQTAVEAATPRTDEAIGLWNSKYHEVVTSHFARTLERELNEAKLALSGRTVSCESCNHVSKERDQAELQIMQLREALSKCKPDEHVGSPDWFEVSALRHEAIFASAAIAGKYVSVEDAKLLLEVLSDIAEHSTPPFVSPKWLDYIHNLASEALRQSKCATVLERTGATTPDVKGLNV